MSEASAPAAPAAAPQSSTPSATPGAKPAAAPAADNRLANGRAPSGQFLPKEGTQGVDKPPAVQQQPGETKEEYRLRRQLKVHGKVEEVDYGEEDIVRELQISRANKKKLADYEARLKAREEQDKLADENPEEFLRAKGRDLDALAKERLLRHIEQEAMSPEQRELAELRAQHEALKSEKAEREANEKKVLREMKKRQVQEARKKLYIPAIQGTGMDVTPETLYLMTETESLMREDGMEVNPESLAAETKRRVNTFTKQYLTNMPIASLIRELGQERIQELLAHTVAEFERTQGVEPVQQEKPAALVQDSKPAEWISEEEWDRRARERRAQRSV